MHPRHTSARRPLAAVLLLVALLISGGSGAGAPAATRTLVPIGSGYEPATLQRFAQAAAQRDTSGTVDLLVLPIPFSVDAFTISNGSRNSNLTLADTRRGQVEQACNAVKSAAQVCRAVLAPILVRADAFLPSNLDLFVADLDGIYILGGDQTVAMRVVADTPTEQRMAAAYANGAVVGGNSAGAAVESLNMIAGYTGNNGPENGLEAGSVDIWLAQGVADQERGLIFGLPGVLLDQHVLQRGRIGRLINAAWSTGLLGVGVDAETAAPIVDERLLTDVAGRSAAFVVDLHTYAATGRYGGPANSLALRRAATHVIPADGGGYDLALRRPLLGGQPLAPPSLAGREFGALKLRRGSGALLLGGDLSGDRAGPAAARFVSLSGGASARLVLLAAGYPKAEAARADAKAYADAFQASFGASTQWFVLDARADQAAIQAAIGNATGVLLAGPDQSLIKPALDGAPAVLAALRTRWQRGMPLLADNAAAAALGPLMTADGLSASDSALEEDSIDDFRPDGVAIQPGLGWLPGVAIEPRMLPDRHWGRLYNLLARDSRALGVGLDAGTALEVTASGASVWGRSAVVLLDGRLATFGVGANGALGARFVMLDSFIDGEAVRP